MSTLDLDAIGWIGEDGVPLSCIEKLRVLRETLEALRQEAQDTLEDAILIGCTEEQIRMVLAQIIEGLENPYRK